jgi:hypothetical protein
MGETDHNSRSYGDREVVSLAIMPFRLGKALCHPRSSLFLRLRSERKVSRPLAWNKIDVTVFLKELEVTNKVKLLRPHFELC